MKITLMIPIGIDRPSGQRYFNIARGLVSRGHKVRILALHPDLERCHDRRYTEAGVEIWYVGQMHVRKRDGIPRRFGPLELIRVVVASTLGMTAAVIRSSADIYHLGKPQAINGMAAILGVRLWHRRPFYLDCDDDEVTSNHLAQPWQRAVFAFWQWLLVKLAKGVTVNTRYRAEIVGRQRGREPIYVPNGVDQFRFRSQEPANIEALRSALGLSGYRIIVYIGTLAVHNHPVHLLIDAFVQLAQSTSNVALLLVGGGEDTERLRQLAADSHIGAPIVFTGHVPPEDVPMYLALAYVSVDPVFDDEVARSRCPLKIFESMAMGIPVVAGDVGDRRDILAQGRAGVLVEAGNTGALASGIASVLDDEPCRQEMALYASDQARYYAWPHLATQWEKAYDRDSLRECSE